VLFFLQIFWLFVVVVVVVAAAWLAILDLKLISLF